MIITRPTYQGVACSSATLKSVIKLCHEHAVPVLVDEAHGSHIHLLEDPSFADALRCGADVVVQSTHKTLTSLSQTAMMHLNHHALPYATHTHRDSFARILGRSFSMLTSTSPNSLLLASLDAARAQLQSSGKQSIQVALEAVQEIKDLCRQHPDKVQVLEDSEELVRRGLCIDPLRLTLRFTVNNNQLIDDKLCDENEIYCELNLKSCITYHISMYSTKQSMAILKASLQGVLEAWDREKGLP